MKPSTAAILELLRKRGARGVSPAEARLLAGCDRLAARVGELRADGFVIVTGTEHNHGEGTHARYRLHEDPVQLSVFDSLQSAPLRDVPSSQGRALQAAERQPQRAAR